MSSRRRSNFRALTALPAVRGPECALKWPFDFSAAGPPEINRRDESGIRDIGAD